MNSDENAVLRSADFDESEANVEFKNKKFAKVSSFSQECEQTFYLIGIKIKVSVTFFVKGLFERLFCD